MAVSKRVRFEVFKRDGFKCVYCGSTPLQSPLVVKLHADHVDPKSLGGEDEPHNLVTAYQNCNLGKSNVPLGNRMPSRFTSDEDKERAEQLREYLHAQREVMGSKKEALAIVLDHWEDCIGQWHDTLPSYVKTAIQDIGLEQTITAVDAVARRDIRRPIEQVKYFCGVVRRARDPQAYEARKKEEQNNAQRSHANETAIAVRGAEWKIVIGAYRNYCEYRFRSGDPLSSPIDELVRKALGGTTAKPAPLSWQDLFKIADEAAWHTQANIYDENHGNAVEREFRRLAEKYTTEGAGELPDRTYVSLDLHTQLPRHDAEVLSREAWEPWREAALPVDWNENFQVFHRAIWDSLTDVLTDLGFWGVVENINKLIPEFKGKTGAEQLAIFRNFYAELVMSQSDAPYRMPCSSIEKWPEYIALKKAP